MILRNTTLSLNHLMERILQTLHRHHIHLLLIGYILKVRLKRIKTIIKVMMRMGSLSSRCKVIVHLIWALILRIDLQKIPSSKIVQKMNEFIAVGVAVNAILTIVFYMLSYDFRFTPVQVEAIRSGLNQVI